MDVLHGPGCIAKCTLCVCVFHISHKVAPSLPATGYAPGLSAPRCPISVLAPKILGGIPSDNAKVLVFPTCQPTTGEGWPKAMRHENACLLCGQNLGYHCHCPPETLLKFQETGRTTHTL